MNLARSVTGIARWLAILGGLVLIVLTVVTCISIVGRTFSRFGLGPVPGDYEIVEAGIGFAVFAFLPWGQLNRGHATVDLFTSFLSARANRVIDLVSELLMLAAIGLITWRLAIGLQDKIGNGEISFILEMPLWWSYAACLAAATVSVGVAVYMVIVRVGEVAAGRSLLEPAQGGMH